MAHRVLFVIRGKLGDTLVAYASVRAYADRYPQDDVALLVRANYAALLAGERGVRVIGFASRVALLVRLARLALVERPFDALLVLWGFGAPVRRLGRLVRARRKIYLDGRWPEVYPEHAEIPPEPLQSEPAWRVVRRFAPELPAPQRLLVPSLAARRAAQGAAAAIGIAPLADEPRRLMSVSALRALVREIAARHPGAPIRVFLNRRDIGAAELVAAGVPPGAEFRFFPALEGLVREFCELARLYATDTGLAHLAAAMDIPATVFFGPTQPWKIVMPGEPHTVAVRLAALGGAHCEEKSCTRPLCLAQAVANYCGGAPGIALADTPATCPLRVLAPGELARISVHENPRRQAR